MLRYVARDTWSVFRGWWFLAKGFLCSLLINYSAFVSLLLPAIRRVVNYLHFHGVRVHLTHVLAAVLHLDALDVQGPGIEVAVRHRQPVIVSYHVLVNGQDGFGVRFNPGHLKGGQQR